MGPKPPPSPFKVAFVQIEVQNHHFTLDTLFLDPYFWPPDQNVDLCSALIMDLKIGPKP